MGKPKFTKNEALLSPDSMGVISGSAHVLLGIGLGQRDLALRGGHPQFSRAIIRTVLQRLRLQILQLRRKRLIRQIANHVVIGRNRIVAQQFPQRDQRLNSRQPGRRDVSLKLQQLQLDLEEVPLADIASLVLRLCNVNRLLKALQILLGKAQGRFRQQDGDELLAHIECQGAFGIRNLAASDRGLVLCSLQSVLSFVAALEEVSKSDVELLHLAQIVGREVGGRKNQVRTESQNSKLDWGADLP